MPFGEPPRQPASQSPADSDITLRISTLDQSSPRIPAMRPRLGIRTWTIAATALLVVAVLVGLFLRATNDPRGALGTLLQIPTPTPEATIEPGANAIYFANAVPWGALTIDTKRFSVNDLTTHEFNGIILSRGRHQLAYQASNFPTLRCVLSVPKAPTDTCPLDTTTGATARGLAGEAGRTIDLGASLDLLPADQRDALLHVITAALQTQKLTTTIAAGDRYLDTRGNVATASEPLTLTLALTTGPTLNAIAPADCNPLCADTNTVIPGLGVDNQWRIRVALFASWTLTNASGQSLGAVEDQQGASFVAPGSNTVNNLVQIGVTLTTSGWRVSGLDGLTQQAGVTAQQNTINQAIAQTHTGAGAQGGGGYAVATGVMGIGDNPLPGCYIVVKDPNMGVTIKMVARFGVAFVIDDGGQPYFTQILHANADEAALMDTLMQQGVPQIPFD